jgi:hypothetical protein
VNDVANSDSGSADSVDVRNITDELPDDLNAVGYVGPYKFPDNSRRRIPGYMYLGLAAICWIIWATVDSSMVNRGWMWAAIALALVGAFSITSGWRMHVDETKALALAGEAVGFPVGHASAQLAWRGLRSRPTWRVLVYSVEEPPRTRGFALIDAIDGHMVSHFTEENPEDWSQYADDSSSDDPESSTETQA